MAKIKLTKNELKKQKEDLKRFTRYLPTLLLKKKQLQIEMGKVIHRLEELKKDKEAFEAYLVSLDNDLDALVSRGSATASRGDILVETKFSRLKKTHANQWEYFIDRVLEGKELEGSIRARLLNINTSAIETRDILQGLGVVDAAEKIREWANFRTENHYKTIMTYYQVIRQRYSLTAIKANMVTRGSIMIQSIYILQFSANCHSCGRIL